MLDCLQKSIEFVLIMCFTQLLFSKKRAICNWSSNSSTLPVTVLYHDIPYWSPQFYSILLHRPIGPQKIVALHLCLLGGESSQTLLESVLVLGGLDDLELAVLDVVDDTVELKVALVHGVDNGRVHSENLQTAQYVVLAESQGLVTLSVHLLQLVCVFHSQLAHGLQPNVQQTKSSVSESGINTTAAGVAADENVLNLEVCDGEFNDGQRVDVGGGDDVGDVAVDENLTRLQAQDGRLGDTRVGTADPENLG